MAAELFSNLSPRTLVVSTMTQSLPDLKQTVDSLIFVTRDFSNQPVKDIAQIYLAALALLCHLNVDRATLQQNE
jgi:hypothetical protein